MAILITDTLIPGENNNHPIIKDIDIHGSLKTVNLINDLHLIPQEKRKKGMLVYCLENDSYFKLNTTLFSYDINDWNLLPNLKEPTNDLTISATTDEIATAASIKQYVDDSINIISSSNIISRNLSATTDPTINDDSANTAGTLWDIGTNATFGSQWLNVTTNELFRCVDPTPGAAIWVNTNVDSNELGALAFLNEIDISELSTDLISNIDEGIAAFSWGNHASQNYLAPSYSGNITGSWIFDNFTQFDNDIVINSNTGGLRLDRTGDVPILMNKINSNLIDNPALDTEFPTAKSVTDYVTDIISNVTYTRKELNETVTGLWNFTNNIEFVNLNTTDTANVNNLVIGASTILTSSGNVISLSSTHEGVATEKAVYDFITTSNIFTSGDWNFNSTLNILNNVNMNNTILFNLNSIAFNEDNISYTGVSQSINEIASDSLLVSELAVRTLSIEDRDRNNHTGTQSFSTIHDFSTGVSSYEKPGYALGGKAAISLNVNTEYYVDGSNQLINLPNATGTGRRILLYGRSGCAGVNIGLTNPSNKLNGVTDDVYTFTEEFEIVLCINSHIDGWTVTKINTPDISNFETISELNTRDVNNRNRSNHTGVQLYNTISNFEAGVLSFENTGFKKRITPTPTLISDSTYILDGIETILTLPNSLTTGDRIQIISNTDAEVRIYPVSGFKLNEVVDGSYIINNKNSVHIFYYLGENGWISKNIEKRDTGWASYSDTNYSSISPLIINENDTSVLENNAGSSITSYLPDGIFSFYDSILNKIILENVGDSYVMRVDFKASSSALNGLAYIKLNIKGTQNVILQKFITFPKGSDLIHDFSFTFNFYSLHDLVSNGGEIKIESVSGNTSIHDVIFLITRVHKQK